jgi:hypothetical protein
MLASAILCPSELELTFVIVKHDGTETRTNTKWKKMKKHGKYRPDV